MIRIDESGVTLFKGEKWEWCCIDLNEKNHHGTVNNPCGAGVVVNKATSLLRRAAVVVSETIENRI